MTSDGFSIVRKCLRKRRRQKKQKDSKRGDVEDVVFIGGGGLGLGLVVVEGTHTVELWCSEAGGLRISPAVCRRVPPRSGASGGFMAF